MKFLSVLKAIGKGALSILGIAQGPIGQLVESALPAGTQPAVSEFNKIAGMVGAAEAVGQMIKNQLAGVTVSGGTVNVSLAKTQALLPSVEAILKESNFVLGRNIADPARFTSGAQKILDGIVDVLDSVEHPQSQAVPDPAPSSASTV